MTNTLNTENLFITTTACVLNQSDKIICPSPTVLCKGLPSYLSNVAASDQKGPLSTGSPRTLQCPAQPPSAP